MHSFDNPNDVEMIATAAQPIQETRNDYDGLLRSIGNSRIVLLGEATHGSHEFYRERIRLTQRLILEKDFNAIAVEADWPDAYRVNQYIGGIGEDASAEQALSSFRRFPAWMWRNRDVLHFVEWLYQNNRTRESGRKVRFYGLDLYSLHTSLSTVIDYLDRVDPEAARKARSWYGCFDRFGEDLQNYGFLTSYGLQRSCEEVVTRQLLSLRRHARQYLRQAGPMSEEDFFNAEQNARLAKNAEAYYRAIFSHRSSSWNLRDNHMTETLTHVSSYLKRSAGNAKVVVWAHNSHIGDARATDMGRHGELNIGQLTRERYEADVFSVGFSTYQGTVTAASGWGGTAELKKVRPALPGSYEQLFHESSLSDFVLDLRNPDLKASLHRPLLERAIGVIYLPQTERQSHYFKALITEQFDALIHIDVTRAVEPLERNLEWVFGEVPETYPSTL